MKASQALEVGSIPIARSIREHSTVRNGGAFLFIIFAIFPVGLLHERPYRLAALATSPALAGEAKMP